VFFDHPANGKYAKAVIVPHRCVEELSKEKIILFFPGSSSRKDKGKAHLVAR
jgi:hypothetical protein